MSNVKQLPQELVDAIIDLLRSERNTLSACSIVCKSWSPRARRLLFHTLRLCSYDVPQKPHEACAEVEAPDWGRFVTDFMSMPTVAALVENLEVIGTINRDNVEDLYDLDEINFDFDDLNYDLIGLGTLLSMAQPLPNLCHIALSSLVLDPTPLPSCHPLRLQSLSLKRVGMLNGGDVLDIFHIFQPYISVSLNIFWLLTDAHEEPALSRTQRGLTAANWRIKGEPDVHPILRGLAGTPFVSHVISLDVKVQRKKELIALNNLLKEVGSRLKSLKLNLFDAFWSSKIECIVPAYIEIASRSKPDVYLAPELVDVWNRAANLASCTGLETLYLRFRAGRTAEPFQDMSHLLSTLPSSVRTLTLAIDFVYFVPERIEALPWHEFGAAVRHGRSLQKILLSLSGGKGEEEAYSRISVAITAQLAGLGDGLEVEFVERDPPYLWSAW